MRKTLYVSSAIKIIIAVLALLGIITVFPLRLYKTDTRVGTNPVTSESTQIINYENTVKEVFVPNGNYLKEIHLYVTEGYPGKTFDFTVISSKTGEVAREKVVIPDNLPQYVNIPMDIDMVLEDPYFIVIESLRSLYVGMENFNPDEIVTAVPYYNEDIIENKIITMDFIYSEPFGLGRSLIIIGGILVFAAALILAVNAAAKKNPGKLITYEQLLKYTLNPLIVLGGIACLICIFMGLVSTHLLDNAVAVIAVILLMLIMLYAVNHDRTGDTPIVTAEYIKNHFSEILQSIAIAGALQGCCEYVSGLYDINHYVAERKEMIWFAFIIITMFSVNEIFNVYNLGYVIVASVAGIFYYRNHINAEMSADELFVQKGNVIIAVLLGFILIRTVKGLIQKKLAMPRVGYAVLMAVYFALIIIFRNTRMWTVTLAVIFTLLYLNFGMWERKKSFNTNVVRGIIIQFILMTLWTWCYRPYCTYRSARFPHYFHTVTVTATYMTLVSCIVLLLLLSKICKLVFTKDDNGQKVLSGTFTLKDIWKELALLSVAVTYLLLTLGRTGYFTAIIVFAFIFIIMLRCRQKGVFKLYLKTFGFILAGVIVFIPVIFEIQRTIPCIVSNPHEYEVDRFEDEVLRKHNLSADEYMTVGRLIETFADKILGIDEAFFDIYHEDEKNKTVLGEYTATVESIWTIMGYHWPGYEISDDAWDKQPEDELLDAYLMKNLDEYYSSPITEIKDLNVLANMPFDQKMENYTNGRLDIYRGYLAALDMKGHNEMGLMGLDGKMMVHAHDVYIQVCYDHGIPTGIVFVIFGAVSFILSVLYFKKSTDKYSATPMLLIMTLAIAGIVEWVYHVSEPVGFAMLLSLAPLLFFKESKEVIK